MARKTLLMKLVLVWRLKVYIWHAMCLRNPYVHFRGDSPTIIVRNHGRRSLYDLVKTSYTHFKKRKCVASIHIVLTVHNPRTNIFQWPCDDPVSNEFRSISSKHRIRRNLAETLPWLHWIYTICVHSPCSLRTMFALNNSYRIRTILVYNVNT